MVCYYLPINWCISKLYPNCNVSAPTKQKSHFWQSGWQHRFFCILVGRFVSEDASPFLQLRKLTSKLVHSKHFADRWCCHRSTWGELSQNLFVEDHAWLYAKAVHLPLYCPHNPFPAPRLQFAQQGESTASKSDIQAFLVFFFLHWCTSSHQEHLIFELGGVVGHCSCSCSVFQLLRVI